MTTPTEGAGWPLVVLCHGFTGSRGGDGHFGPLAARLAHAGIASIAMDFPGCGESEEPFTAYTLTNIRADMTAAIAYMGVTYGADTTRLGLVGHSMGGPRRQPVPGRPGLPCDRRRPVEPGGQYRAGWAGISGP